MVLGCSLLRFHFPDIYTLQHNNHECQDMNVKTKETYRKSYR